MYRMIDEEHIEVAIAVIIEKNRLGVESFKVYTIFMCFFSKTKITVVDEELIFARKVFIFSYLANIYIVQAIAVYIGNGNTGFPVTLAGNTRFNGYIFK